MLKIIMTTIVSTARLQQYPADWQTPDEVLKNLYMPFIADVEKVLPIREVAVIVGEYAKYNLHPNCTLWYEALRKLHLLPERVPPLPANTMELFDRNCFVNPY